MDFQDSFLLLISAAGYRGRNDAINIPVYTLKMTLHRNELKRNEVEIPVVCL